MTRYLCNVIPLALMVAACTALAIPAPAIPAPAAPVTDTADTVYIEPADIINNCLDDNTARQCRALYPEYADDAQLIEELAAQAKRCGTRTDNECEE